MVRGGQADRTVRRAKIFELAKVVLIRAFPPSLTDYPWVSEASYDSIVLLFTLQTLDKKLDLHKFALCKYVENM